MNILLLHAHAIMPNSQGISKVLLTLRSLFRKSGHNVLSVAMRNYYHEVSDDEQQFYLPSAEIYSEENIKYLKQIMQRHHIDNTVNTCCQIDELRLISECCHQCNVPLTTGVHNMILTPIYNVAAVNEFKLRKNHLSFVYYLLRLPVIKNLLCKIYIKRHHKYFDGIYKYSDAVVLLNKTMEQEFLQMTGRKDSNKTYVIPNTLDENPSDICKDKENIVLWVGKMDTSIKRPDLMLRIWKKVEGQHPDWRLLMLGKGSGAGESVWNEMKDLSKELGLKHVSFEGQVVTKPYYEKAKICCITSTHEAFPLVLVESLFNGVIPIAFNSFPTASQLIRENVNGLLVSPFNINEYSNKLSSLMENNETRLSMMNKRQETLDEISSERVFHKWISMFNQLHK